MYSLKWLAGMANKDGHWFKRQGPGFPGPLLYKSDDVKVIRVPECSCCVP